jgi:mRNA-degrading endonuclease RelE of RelBE toxin-antitoxin system
MVKVIVSEKYEKSVLKIKDASIKERLIKLMYKIKENPEIGKPIRYNRKGTREVYFGSFRMSYAYEKQTETIYLLEFYHKDEQ